MRFHSASRTIDDLSRMLAAVTRAFLWLTVVIVTLFGSVLYAAFGPRRRKGD